MVYVLWKQGYCALVTCGTTGMVRNVRQCKYKAKKHPGEGTRFFSSPKRQDRLWASV